MPRVYERKQNISPRGQWTEQNLAEAARRYTAGEIGLREAERLYGVPTRTLTRRIASGKLIKRGLGPEGVLGYANEKRLVAHIQRLASSGFAPDRPTVRRLAYQFAEKLGIKHSFSHVKQMAGYDWLASFLERNPELSVRQAEGLSLARAQGMNRTETGNFFKLLEEVLTKENLMNKPQNIFNMDESGIQLINKPGKVVTMKGAKDIHVLTPRERGENITVIACNSAEGVFLPLVLIMKGVNRKKEFSDGLPHGSDVYMNDKSSYINTELFLRWFKEHFLPRKPPGKVLLIMDGHTSHYNALEMLNLADDNGVTILCLPSHTTQALQPLDRSFFGPLKTYYNQEAKTWMQHHEGRNITRYQVGYLIGKAWKKAASVGNAVSGFKATGIFPLNSNAIPNHFYSLSDTTSPPSQSDITCPDPKPSTSRAKTPPLAFPNPSPPTSQTRTPSTLTSKSPSIVPSNESPSKHLHEISPIPKLPLPRTKRSRQSATVLTSPEHIEKCKKSQKNKAKKKKN